MEKSHFRWTTFRGAGQVLQHVSGSTFNLCEASADYCTTLESEALQSEFEKKLHDDPSNWSPLHQSVEAFRSIKELHASPPERIPESFVRGVLARQYGIKPEEVTEKQIIFEVTGLFPFYPHIELIPAVPQENVSPTAEPKDDHVGKELIQKEDQSEPIEPSVSNETIATQLERLRDECRWTIPQLAEAARY